MEEHYRRAAEIIHEAKTVICLTGAGISVESGIPDFRSACGLWEKYDPMEYAHIDAFRRNPEKIWKMVFELIELTTKAAPNPAHLALAELERRNILRSIITQNIDNLHRQRQQKSYRIPWKREPPRLPQLRAELRRERVRSQRHAAALPRLFGGPQAECRVLRGGHPHAGAGRIGAAVESRRRDTGRRDLGRRVPASSIPFIVKSNGGRVIEMNLETTGLTNSITDVFIQGPAGRTLPELIACCRAPPGGRGRCGAPAGKIVSRRIGPWTAYRYFRIR
jgi:NAD-dependent deacetylase